MRAVESGIASISECDGGEGRERERGGGSFQQVWHVAVINLRYSAVALARGASL